MCGRYVVAKEADYLAHLFHAQIAEGLEVRESYNLAPQQRAPIVVEHDGGRELVSAQWGLIPPWAPEPVMKFPTFNARSETAADKNTFKSAFRKKRALVPFEGYYEWQKPAKTPLYIHPETEVSAFAGLYGWWHNTAEDSWLLSFTILTAAALQEMADVHDRMPVVLPESLWDSWVDESEKPADEVDALLREAVTQMPETLSWHEVGKAVGNVRTQGPELREPI